MTVRKGILIVLLVCASICSPAFAQEDPPPIQILPNFAFSGSWYEIGRQQGQMQFMDIMSFGFFYAQRILGVTPDEVKQYYEDIKEMIPENIDQHMKGMAYGYSEATGFTYEKAWDTVLCANLFNLIKSKEAIPTHFLMGSAFVVASKGKTYVALNYDDREYEEEYLAVTKYAPDTQDYHYVSLFERGFAYAFWAVNDQGLAIAYLDSSPNKNPSVGLPTSFLGRMLLENTASVKDAVAFCRAFFDAGGRFGDSCNLILADLRGHKIARLQICSDRLKVSYGKRIKPGTKYLAATNHFDRGFSRLPKDWQDRPYYVSSVERLKQLRKLVPSLAKYDAESCWEVLTDHGDGEPTANTICTDFDNAGTALSIVMSSDAIDYTTGRPDVYLDTFGSPQHIDLSQMFSSAASN